MQKNHLEKKGSSTSSKSTDIQDNKLLEDQQMTEEDHRDKFQESNQFIRDSYYSSEESDSQRKYKHPAERSKSLAIFITLLLMILVISTTYFYKDILTYLVFKLDLIEQEQHSKNSKFNQDKNLYKISSFQDSYLINYDENLINICPLTSETFHVDLEQSYQNKKLPENILNQIDLCQTSILGLKDLQQLKQRWNWKFPQIQIKDEIIASLKTKQNLLVLLKLFFSAGTYLNITVPYSKVHYRCKKSTLTGFDTIFSSSFQKNQQNIIVPNSDIFMKVRFPYSPFIKEMIEKITKNEDYLDQCRKKQCLVIKCLD